MPGTQPPDFKLATSKLLRAAQFAAQRHARQRRKGDGDEPYVNHLIEVALLLAELPEDLDMDIAIAGLLHDKIEDAGVTRGELESRFGERVATLVEEVTDDKRLSRATRKALQIQAAPHKSEGAQNLSTADKISNLRSTLTNPPTGWDLARRTEYFRWAKEVVDRFPAVDPALRAEFDRTYAKFADLEGESLEEAASSPNTGRM